MSDESSTAVTRDDRAKMKTLVTYITPELSREFRLIAATLDMTSQQLGKMAIEELVQQKRHLITHRGELAFKTDEERKIAEQAVLEFRAKSEAAANRRQSTGTSRPVK